MADDVFWFKRIHLGQFAQRDLRWDYPGGLGDPPTTELLRHYHLLELIGENRLYPTNRHAIAAFRGERRHAVSEKTAQ
jgi:hypothetical protein